MNKPKPKSAALKIIPLGGLHEIGKNTCIFEYNDEMVLLDAGIGFPTDGMHGVNVVLPDMTYVQENRHKIKGMIVTHGHEDHIGGIAYHLKQFNIPHIYGPRLAMSLLRDKLAEAGVSDRTEIHTVSPRDMVRISPSFLVEYIRNTHSMADSFSVAIHTPLGIVIHTGDFKIDYTPVDGEHFDLQKLAEHGENGVLCLLSDSTNAEVPGHTASEESVRPNLDRIIASTPKRIFITTFASSVHRVNIILSLAQKHNRKVVVVGRSMLNVIAHARELGYIKCPDNLFVPLKQMPSLPDEKILVLTTGSQGEELAALTRISKGEHRQVSVREGDTVVFSANPIPGNTLAVVDTIDRLIMKGANVIYGRQHGIHVSGHGSREDHKLMLALTRPKFFVPVHGQYRMLVEHAKMAQSMGIPEENMVIINNGDIVEVSPERIRIAGQVPSGIKLVDGSGIVHDHVMKERQQLAEDGVVTIAAAVDAQLKLLARPEIHLRGVARNIEREMFQQIVNRSISRVLNDRGAEFIRSQSNQADMDWVGLKEEIEAALIRLIRRELNCRPSVVFLLQTPDNQEMATATHSSSPRRRRRSTASAAS
ncbi:ribonuclease J [Spirulina major CS-329]|uniref:ribonuclease J n=1 Tax=Spirulina TaxID=1154 RepID=UPI00232E02C5|nr:MULTISPECIES: ribonuclease J [Spirulina]MDB9495763.1 ribonuclease J [Spirulina subsalsa CS-330]MDB9503829.1 ribonuclease J [Spirulina major CS-329]